MSHALNKRLPIQLSLAGVVSVCAMVYGTGVQAADLNLKLDVSFGHNSNLFRSNGFLPPDAPEDSLPAVVSTSTQQQMLTLGAGFPLDSDATRLQLSAQLGRYRYGAASLLDTTSTDVGVRLPWRFTEWLDGELAAGHQNLPYAVDESYRRLDRVRREWHTASLVLKPVADISVPLHYTSADARHSDEVQHGRLNDSRRTYGAGVRYQSPTGSALQAGLVRTTASFPNRSREDVADSDRYRDTDTYVDVDWVSSPMLRLTGRLTSKARAFSYLDGVDARIWTYRMGANYTLSPKTRFDVYAWRQTSDSDDRRVLYSLSKGLQAGMLWQMTPKTSALLQFQRDTQADSATPDATGALFNNPVTRRFGVRVQHEIDRGFTAYVDAARERRNGAISGIAQQTTFRVGLEYSYENMTGAAARNVAVQPPAQ